ncbi:MAG: hypothetical protein DME53_11560 [Verrucomicrobia bacterium]|nr:MAG: hypothetical protein DME56_05895 [Verrucomicrobiota bacterium]PYK43645.1 MAG: hypothetical protein DME53_11560 [Verrucomicrobiota bacterium]
MMHRVRKESSLIMRRNPLEATIKAMRRRILPQSRDDRDSMLIQLMSDVTRPLSFWKLDSCGLIRLD